MSKKQAPRLSASMTCISTSWKAMPQTAAAVGKAMFESYVSNQDKIDNNARGNMLAFLKDRPSNERIEECIAAINAAWTKYREAHIAAAQQGLEGEKEREAAAEKVSKWLRGGRAKRKAELVGVLDGAKVQMTFCITALETMGYHAAVQAINAKRREAGSGGNSGNANRSETAVSEPSEETAAALANAQNILRKSDDALAAVVSVADDNAVFNSVIAGIAKLAASTGRHKELGEMLQETYEAWKASNRLTTRPTVAEVQAETAAKKGKKVA